MTRLRPDALDLRLDQLGTRPPFSAAYHRRVARGCVFCGGLDLTREHVWGRWLQKLNPPGSTHTLESKRYEDVISERTAPEPELIVKWVCKTCNTGWMARLEAEASPILTRMILGDPKVTLWRDQQPTIAAWALKTAMVLEYTNPAHPVYFTDSERAALAHDRTIPLKTSVVLYAHNAERRTRVAAGRDYEARARQTGESFRAYFVTLQLERLVVQVISHRNPYREANLPEGPALDLLVPVWPVTAIRWWPPRVILDDARLDQVIEPWEVQAKQPTSWDPRRP